MSRYYYDDPIETFESDDYYAQDVYTEQHLHGYANTGIDNWHDDGFNLEYGQYMRNINTVLYLMTQVFLPHRLSD